MRKGLQFDVYASALGGQVKKATIEITTVRASSSDAVVLPPKTDQAAGPGHRLGAHRSAHEVLGLRRRRHGRDQPRWNWSSPRRGRTASRPTAWRSWNANWAPEAKEKYLKEKEEPTHPPSELGKGFVRIVAGDWINNPDFVPIIPETAYQKKTDG